MVSADVLKSLVSVEGMTAYINSLRAESWKAVQSTGVAAFNALSNASEGMGAFGDLFYGRNLKFVTPILFGIVLLMGCAPTPDGLPATPTPDLDDDRPGLVDTVPTDIALPDEIEIVPTPITAVEVAQMSPEDFANHAPGYVPGQVEGFGLPQGLEAISLSPEGRQSLAEVAQVPLAHAGVAVGYLDAQTGMTHAPILTEMGDPDTSAVFYPAGEVDDNGVLKYEASDGSVRYVRTAVVCPAGSTCLQTVDFHSEENAGQLNWLLLGGDGEINGVAPAVTAEYPAEPISFSEVGDRWDASLSGAAAMIAGRGRGMEWVESENGEGNVLFFIAEGENYQANDEDIHYNRGSDTLWIQTEQGLFVSDPDTGDWDKVESPLDGAGIFETGGKQFVLMGDQLMWVESVNDENGSTKVVTKDGQTLVWDGDEWGVVEESVEVGNMSEFDYSMVWEKGNKIEVADLYGAGLATMTVDAIKLPSVGQTMEYKNFDWLRQEPAEVNGYHYERMSMKNLTIEGISLLTVDIKDNSVIADGQWAVLRLGTIMDGQQTSFDLWIGGNFFTNLTASKIFDSHEPSELLTDIAITYHPEGGLGLDNMGSIINIKDLSPEEVAQVFLSRLGSGSRQMRTVDILNIIREGGVLDKSMVGVSALISSK